MMHLCLKKLVFVLKTPFSDGGPPRPAGAGARARTSGANNRPSQRTVPAPAAHPRAAGTASWLSATDTPAPNVGGPRPGPPSGRLSGPRPSDGGNYVPGVADARSEPTDGFPAVGVEDQGQGTSTAL